MTVNSHPENALTLQLRQKFSVVPAQGAAGVIVPDEDLADHCKSAFLIRLMSFRDLHRATPALCGRCRIQLSQDAPQPVPM
jgi:hypothetical protein